MFEIVLIAASVVGFMLLKAWLTFDYSLFNPQVSEVKEKPSKQAFIFALSKAEQLSLEKQISLREAILYSLKNLGYEEPSTYPLSALYKQWEPAQQHWAENQMKLISDGINTNNFIEKISKCVLESSDYFFENC